MKTKAPAPSPVLPGESTPIPATPSPAPTLGKRSKKLAAVVRSANPEALQRALQELTPVQRETICGLIAGKSNKQIAAERGVSAASVSIAAGSGLTRLAMLLPASPSRIPAEPTPRSSSSMARAARDLPSTVKPWQRRSADKVEPRASSQRAIRTPKAKPLTREEEAALLADYSAAKREVLEAVLGSRFGVLALLVQGDAWLAGKASLSDWTLLDADTPEPERGKAANEDAVRTHVVALLAQVRSLSADHSRNQRAILAAATALLPNSAWLDGVAAEVGRLRAEAHRGTQTSSLAQAGWPESREMLDATWARLRRATEVQRRVGDQLIRANQGLIWMHAQRSRGRGLPLEDLFQEGTVGLLKAIDRFDPTCGNKLMTYASWWIRHCIGRAIENQGKTIRIPVHAQAANARLDAAAQRLLLTRASSTDEDLAAATNLKISKVQTLRGLPVHPLFLNARLSGDSQTEVGDLFADPRVPAADDQLCSATELQLLRKAVAQLPAREAFVVRRRLNLDGEGEMTLAELGEQLGITKERVRQIEKSAIEAVTAYCRRRS